MEPSKTREHPRVELRVKTPHYDLITHYEEEGKDFYEVLDHVINVMYRSLLQEKEKMIDARKHRIKLEKAFDFEKQEYEEEVYDDSEEHDE